MIQAGGAAPGQRHCNQPEAPSLGLKRHNRLEAPPVHICTMVEVHMCTSTMSEAYSPDQRHFHQAKSACTRQKGAPIRSEVPNQASGALTRPWASQSEGRAPMCTRPEAPYQV